MQTMCKPCANQCKPVQTMCKPCGNHMKTMWGPCGNHMKTITQGHLGHALGREAGNEAVAQVAHTADVDVAPCRRTSPQGLRGSGSAPRLPSWGCAGTGCPAASPVLLPRCADGGHVPGWPASGSSSPRRCPRRSPISSVKARATVTLCSATPVGTLDCC